MARAAENPFRVARIEALAYRAPDFCWDAFVETLRRRNFRGAIVGPHGSGKTTLLIEAQARLEAVGIPVRYVFLNQEMPGKGRQVRHALGETPSRTVLFLDGAEQLNPFLWWWLRLRTRRLRGFVVTLHRAGRLPTIYRTHASEGLLRELLSQLAPEEWERHWPHAQAYYTRCRGNLREVFFALYDDCAREGR